MTLTPPTPRLIATPHAPQASEPQAAPPASAAQPALLASAAQPAPWLSPTSLVLCRRLLTSHRLAFGRGLLAANQAQLSESQAAQELFAAPQVVLAHDGSADPLLTYGNRAALRLWKRPWSTLVGLPSRLTAEASQRHERQRMLERAWAAGAIEGYTGVRVDSEGRRFQIRAARLWSLVDGDGRPCGQAAAFSDWCWLE